MLLPISGLLSPEEVRSARTILDAAEWVDGRATAGHQSARAKMNRQLRESDPRAVQLGEMILDRLGGNALFISAALPQRVFPPLFNRYEAGENFGTHIDNAIRQVQGTSHRIRTDLAATLFLTGPDEYEGGELVIEDTFGTHSVKLPAGDMVLYPASSRHYVRPVARGSRIASFFWVQSMVRDDGERALLFDLDLAVQQIHRERDDHPAAVALTGVYHNLLRRWADV
ncbi:MAG: Fe2+-dependent dioxygenase [Acidobacteriota bacterium]